MNNAPVTASKGVMRTTIGTFAGALGLLAALPAGGNGNGDAEAEKVAHACVERGVEIVQQRYESIPDLRARFVQTTHSVALGAGRPSALTTSQGTVAFAKPGRMRWSYEKPEPSLVVSDGETLSLYDPSRRELQRLRVGAGHLSGTAILFLLGEGDILREFEVSPRSCEAAAIELDLVPRQAATYERVRIRVDPETGDVVRTAIVDLLGNRTEVAFEGIEVDFDPEPGFFTFDPPPGAKVIDLDAPIGRSER